MAGTSEAVSDAGIVFPIGFTEVKTSETMEDMLLLTLVGKASTSDLTEETMLAVSVGMASRSDLTDEMMLLISVGRASTFDLTEDATLEMMLLTLVGTASTSDLTEERTLLMIEGAWLISDFTDTTLSTADVILATLETRSERIDEIGRISDREGAAVVSGTSVLVLKCEVEVASKLVVAGSSVWLVSVGFFAWDGELDRTTVSDLVVSSMDSGDEVRASPLEEVVSAALVVGTSVTTDSDVAAADSLFRLRVCDGVSVLVNPDSAGSLLVVCGTSELASDVESTAFELAVLSPSVAFEATLNVDPGNSVAECGIGTIVVDDSKLRLVFDNVEASVADGAALEATSEVAALEDSGMVVELGSVTIAAVPEIDMLETGSKVERPSEADEVVEMAVVWSGVLVVAGPLEVVATWDVDVTSS